MKSETLYISHGADPNDWFIVEPREGRTLQSMAGTPITPEKEVYHLLRSGRTVYKIKARPYLGKTFRHRRRIRMASRWRS